MYDPENWPTWAKVAWTVFWALGSIVYVIVKGASV
jgi:hypothetical protein